MKTYSIINQKGGVGKTTSTYNLGKAIADTGKKVLIVDFDPQASLTISTGFNPEELDNTIVDVIISFNRKRRRDIKQTILKLDDNLFLVPSVVDLSVADNISENILKKSLESVANDFDYCLIDCPPSLNKLSINALVACNSCIIPVSCDFLALKGVELLEETIAQIKRNLNPDLEVLGTLATFHNRTRHARENLKDLQERYNVIGVIGTTVKAKDAIYTGKPLVDFDKRCVVAKQYREVAERVCLA